MEDKGSMQSDKMSYQMGTKDKPYQVIGYNDFERVSRFFSTRVGKGLINILFSIFKIHRVNSVNYQAMSLPVEEVSDFMMRDFGIKVVVEGKERLESLKEGGFFSVSNHPFGAIEGIALTGLLLSCRRDAKVMVNDILLRIASLKEVFLGVTPQIGYKKNQQPSMMGMRAVLQHIREGHPLGLFPAGAVSLYGKRNYIADRAWQPTAIKLIKQYKRPVLPIFFHGYNSPYYYNLEKIHIALRTLFLPRQIFNKKGFTLKISIGEPISVEEQEKCGTLKELGLFLRRKTYELSGDERLINTKE